MLNDTTGSPPAEVTRVICASVSRVEGSVMDELFKIRNRNCEADPVGIVRGALLYSRGWFVLWLEGREAEVEAVVSKAALDPRNAHQKVIHRSRGPATLTETITVAATQGAEGPGAFGRRVYHLKQQFDQGLALEPAALWQHLSAPCIAAPGRADVPDHHIALVSAEANGPIDLLRKLGERFHSPVVYQRFASGKSHSSDVGVAYVDFVVAGQIRRVQLLSRRALAHRMVRQSLAGLDSIVLMLGSRPAAAIDLATGVAACADTLPAWPAIHLVAASDEIAGTVGGLLRQRAAAGSMSVLMQLQEEQLADFALGRWHLGAVDSQGAYATA
jgi:hypothetical protein